MISKKLVIQILKLVISFQNDILHVLQLLTKKHCPKAVLGFGTL